MAPNPKGRAALLAMRHRFIRDLRGLVLAAAMATVSAQSVEARSVLCTGPDDNTVLAQTTLRIDATRRAVFVKRVQDAYASREGYSFLGGPNEDGTIDMFFGRYRSGVTMGLGDYEKLNSFRATVTTCNASEDWKPYWAELKAFVEASRDLAAPANAAD